MKKIQNFYLYSYRVVGFIFLVGLISSILWYGFSILFFISNSSWGIPVVLSPNQEKVMSHLEHLLVLEQNAAKDTAQLSALTAMLHHKKKMLKVAHHLQRRIQKTIKSQSKQYARNSKIFKQLSKEKAETVLKLDLIVQQIKKRDRDITQELTTGLITREEALAARAASSKLRSELVDAKAHLHQLNQKSRDFSRAASTLNGSDKNISAMYKVVKKVEWDSQIAQLKSDIVSLKLNINQLRNTIKRKNSALSTMKESPYVQATKLPTTVAFVPYPHLRKIVAGTPVYSCYLDMIFCYKSGQVSRIYDAEEYFPHPLFKSEVKGQLLGITFNSARDSHRKLLFLNYKPLLV